MAVVTTALLLLLLLLQDLLTVAVSLARMRYYDAELLHAAASRFAAAAAAVQAHAVPDSTSGAGGLGMQLLDDSQQGFLQAAGGRGSQPHRMQGKQQQQQQQGKRCPSSATADNAAGSLAGITQQLIVNYLWSNASLAYSNKQLLSAALHALLAVPEGLGSTSNPIFLQALNPRLAPLCSWSLATMLVCLLAERPRVQGFDGAQELERPRVQGFYGAQELAEQHGAVESATNGSSESNGSAAAAGCNNTGKDSTVWQLTHAVAAVGGALECKAAAAAAAGSANRASSRSARSKSGSSSSSAVSAVRFDQEGLAQLHHAHLLATAAVTAACQATLVAADDLALTPAAVAEQQATEQLAGLTAAAAAAAQCSDEQLAAFREQCRAAWQQSRQARQATSYLQLQVHEVSVNKYIPIVSRHHISMLQQQQLTRKQQQWDCTT
jgi:hypothetical protein